MFRGNGFIHADGYKGPAIDRCTQNGQVTRYTGFKIIAQLFKVVSRTHIGYRANEHNTIYGLSFGSQFPGEYRQLLLFELFQFTAHFLVIFL